MTFISLSTGADKHLIQINHFEQIRTKYLIMDFKRLNSCDLEIFIITEDPLEEARLNQPGLDKALIKDLQKAWAGVCRADRLDEKQNYHFMEVIRGYTQPLINPDHEKDCLIRLVRASHAKTQVVSFLKQDTFLPINSILMLSRACKVLQGMIPLHVSAVSFQGEMHLFGGPSGAGKSTAARHLVSLGGHLLDEDQVLIRQEPDGSFCADAWGYLLQSCQAPIKAVFRLEKADQNILTPITSPQAASFLMSQADQVAGWMLHDRLYQQLFTNVASMARHVPVYHLRFKHEGGFWPLIREALNA